MFAETIHYINKRSPIKNAWSDWIDSWLRHNQINQVKKNRKEKKKKSSRGSIGLVIEGKRGGSRVVGGVVAVGQNVQLMPSAHIFLFFELYELQHSLLVHPLF